MLSKSFTIFMVSLVATGCAYSFGYRQRDLPGGYKQVAIPVFQNKTQQVGVEALFTNEMIRQFNRSKVAHVVDVNHAPVTLEGVIKDIKYSHGSQVKAEDTKYKLPAGAVLTIEYRVILDAEVSLRRNSDQKIIWTSNFSSEKVYTAPQIGLPVINSANALYNHSARMDVFERMAKDLMNEAHDRMTENF